MATSTFHKNIELDQAAAERLAEILERPAPPRPSREELRKRWEENDRKVKEFLSNLKRG